ncbi:MAG: Fe(3+) ABC transporter substrate-binding protein [Planctomycetota bacterium]
MRRLVLATVLSFLVSPIAALAAGEVNVYSSRHYDSDDELYALFTEQTGIEVNIIEGNTDELITRLEREGDLSPGDIFIAVDAGRLHKAVEADLLQPTQSDVLAERIPETLRHPDGLWFGYSKRARVFVTSPDIDADFVTTYAELADSKLEGSLVIRSSSNIYNQSLVAAMIARYGTEATQNWVDGMVENFARRPQGGDRDQIRAVAAGEGDLAVVNHYYFARMLAGSDAADREAAGKLTLIWPDQQGDGVHVNVSGAGMLKNAPNAENAKALLEFLASNEAQKLWALANFEYPVVEDSSLELPDVLVGFGTFKSDSVNAAKLGENNREAVRVMDRAGWR